MNSNRLTSAARAAAVPPFHAMEMAAAAQRREAEGHRVLHLELGQPSTPAPAIARRAAQAALEDGAVLGYTGAPGLGALRERLAAHDSQRSATAIAPERITVVAGASAGFTLAFLAAFDTGDRVGVLEPGYPCYRNTLIALGIEPVVLPVGPATRFAPTPEMLDAAGPLDGLVIASPSNPTGTVLDAATWTTLAHWCATRGVRLVVDELYHGLVYTTPGIHGDDEAATTVATALSCVDDAIVINSFSKYFSMTGWRLGWMITPPEITGAVERLAQNLYICAPHISQIAGIAALDARDELDGHLERYRINRRVLLDALVAAGLTDLAPADGAFYVYGDVSEILARRQIPDSSALCRLWLEELDIACSPGVDFDLGRGHHTVRWSYAGSTSDIVEAAQRLSDWIGDRP